MMERWNVLAGGVLASLLVAIAVSELGDLMYARPTLATPAYAWLSVDDGVESEPPSAGVESGAGEVAALPEGTGDAVELVVAVGDAKAGAKVLRRCVACHDASARQITKVGPPLFGVVGRIVGSHPGYAYSAGLRAAGAEGARWGASELLRYVQSPKKLFPGTKMNFPGIRKEKDRANLVAYLATLSIAP